MKGKHVRHGPSRMRQAALGLFAIVLFVAAVGGTWFFLKGGFVGGTPVRAVFSAPGTGQQLPVGGDVKVRGVLVGRISDVSLARDGKVVVSMRLNAEGRRLPRDSSAEIGSKTLFGEKWIELVPPPGSSQGPFLAQGDVIPDERTEEPLELERELQLGHDLLAAIPLDDLASLLKSLARGFSDGRSITGAHHAIDQGLKALRAVNSRASDLDLALRQLNEFAAFLDDNDADLLAFMSSFDSANRALVGAAPEFSASLRSVPVLLNDLASFQERTESDLGRLVEHGATVAEFVAERHDKLTDIVVQLEAFLTVWNSGLKQPCAGLYESDMTCWQIYLTPGLDSRGLYGDSAAPPNANEPGDPGTGIRSIRTVDARERFEALLRRFGGSAPPSDLAELLYAPTSGSYGPSAGSP